MRILCVFLLGVSVSILGCGGDDDESTAGGSGAGAGSGSSSSTGGDPVPATPSGYLLITKERLDALHDEVKAGAPAWKALLENVDKNMDELDINNCSAENVALVYLLTGDARYATAAYAWAKQAMEDDVTSDSYLEFGHLMRSVALVLNYCSPGLSSEQRVELADYLERWTNELWFDNKGDGWGIADPGNNYHMAFLEGTAYAGYALKVAERAKGDDYIALLKDKLEGPKGVMAYLDTQGKGGDWQEGANYGERSKQRLFSALAVVASMGDANYFDKNPFFADSLIYAFYQLQPDNLSIYPSGDVARDSTMPASPFERDYIQTAAHWLADKETRSRAAWYLANVTPTFEVPGFRGLILKDVLFPVDDAAKAPDDMPLMYRAEGNQWINVRTGWDAHATTVTISGTPLLEQSHAHFDVGSFTMWKEDWQAVDPVTFSHDGLNWDAGAHNMVTVTGHERRGGDVPGFVRMHDEAAYSYVAVDASNLFRKRVDGEEILLLSEYTRELVYLKPDTMVVYDRVAPKDGNEYEWRLHFPAQPTFASGRYSADYKGAGMSLVVLVGQSPEIHDDTDLVDGSSDAFRVSEAPPSSGRFLNVVQVASGGAPALTAEHVTSAQEVEGALWKDQVVVFSKLPKGAPAPLPFTYSVPGSGKRTHTLVGMTGNCDIAASNDGTSTTVVVTAGSGHPASAEGIVRFDE